MFRPAYSAPPAEPTSKARLAPAARGTEPPRGGLIPRFFRVAARLLGFGLEVLWTKARRRLTRDQSPSPLPRRFRELLEQLGGLFVKLGQFIAMRPDLAPPQLVRETEKLLDQVPCFPEDVAVATVEHELGRPIHDLFARFDPTPVAAASFAQVHRALLPSGEVVAVKILRPGLEEQVNADLRLMHWLFWLVELSGLTRRIRLSEMLDEFEHWTLEELDLRKEAAFATALRGSDVEIPAEYIPQVYWSHTTARVLTLEFLTGVWMSDLKAAVETGEIDQPHWRAKRLDLKRIAFHIFDNMLRQVFERNTFHGDPHAGNLVILDGCRIGYVDFGITGQIDARFRDIQMAVLSSLSTSDFDGYYRAVIKFFYPLPSNADIIAIRREMIRGAREWANAQFNAKADIAEQGTSVLLRNVLEVARRYELSVSSVALRYFRAVIAIEALILTLDPSFAYRDHLKRSIFGIEVRQIRRRSTPDATVTAMVGLLSAFQILPQRLLRSLGDLEEVRRTSNFVGIAQSVFAAVLRISSRFVLLAALGVLANMAFQLVPLSPRMSWSMVLGLIATWLVVAIMARKSYLSSLPVSGD